MNTLSIAPFQDRLHYAFFSSCGRRAVVSGDIIFNWDDDARLAELEKMLSSLPGRPDLIALRALFGGSLFKAPEMVSTESVQKLSSLITQAPLHTPRLLALIDTCREFLSDTPFVIVFDTSFFTRLPEREYSYGLDPALARKMNLRRYGYHGIFHEAACAFASENLRRDQGRATAARTISICLQPKPEIAAVRGLNPLMVTSGATPLEGLPGRTSCGDLDPSVVLTLAEKKGWGPERIDRTLTHESGLAGLTGETTDIDTIMRSSEAKYGLAREVMAHRILLACGAAKAALGGVDAIVFSGEHNETGEIIGPALVERLASKDSGADSFPEWYCYGEPLTRIMADMALATIRNDAPAPAR